MVRVRPAGVFPNSKSASGGAGAKARQSARVDFTRLKAGAPAIGAARGVDAVGAPSALRARFSGLKASAAGLCVVLLLLCAVLAPAQQWTSVGPDGGDVRSLTYDPRNPSRVYLGTSSGQMFVSSDNGLSWARLAHLGSGDDTVIDHVAINPDTGVMFAATWRADDNSDGDLYRSTDSGQTWQMIAGMHGKSIRSFGMAQANSNLLVAGALDGVYRSNDAGQTWERISPERHAEIKNIESIAIDPRNPEIIYAGTWHLPWKTTDGGLTWQSIKKGVIDDSDVFSIIVAENNSNVVYASACSGIYKSINAGEEFRKIQGIPATARRTRVLKQDPRNGFVVYAGTTEGLWKTTDAGNTFNRITPANVIVNDVLVDPRNSGHVLVATDRGGVLLSEDGGETFTAANRGFSHRHVASLIVDRNDSSVLYAGVINDKEYGGVFVSSDGGTQWQQRNAGLGARDIFVLRQLDSGALLAGTNTGLFRFNPERNQWEAAGDIEREIIKSMPVRATKRQKARVMMVGRIEHENLQARIYDIETSGKRVYAATSEGLFYSDDDAQSWHGMRAGGNSDIISISPQPGIIVAATPRKVIASVDNGRTWYEAKLPPYVTKVNSVSVDGQSTIWAATREGALRSGDGGDTWEHVLAGLPHNHVLSIVYDPEGHRWLATAAGAPDVFESTDGGRNWHRNEAGFSVRGVVSVHGRLLANTAFDGVVIQAGSERAATPAVSGAAQP